MTRYDGPALGCDQDGGPPVRGLSWLAGERQQRPGSGLLEPPALSHRPATTTRGSRRCAPAASEMSVGAQARPCAALRCNSEFANIRYEPEQDVVRRCTSLMYHTSNLGSRHLEFSVTGRFADRTKIGIGHSGIVEGCKVAIRAKLLASKQSL